MLPHMKRIALTAALVLIATFALADGRHGRGAGDRKLQGLELTDAQRAQIGQLQAQFKQAQREAFESAREVSREYREAKRAGDTAKVAALQPQVDKKREELKSLRKAQHEQIRALLTPEQQQQWDESRRRHRRKP